MNSSFNHVRAQHSPASERSIHPDKLDQIIEAIASGKYSWACVLLLRFSGYNPLHYIPYSTYNRIVKDAEPLPSHHNRPVVTTVATPSATNEPVLNQKATPPMTTAIQDLAYLEVVPEEAGKFSGGFAWRSVWPF
jgi:hypothetical protein